ncbi:4F5 domain-containing protein [Rhizoctonia solani AG-1 IA]|uniref:4F5 domain-containing protein n=1 Tax=Thanatephorus cucumeris (strain AG1-IA) TaxID=983506 RepID=L8WZ17_THACA|nr:4F5 domain-containing protein [Rhizoctonia solani AG-1 IA]
MLTGLSQPGVDDQRGIKAKLPLGGYTPCDLHDFWRPEPTFSPVTTVYLALILRDHDRERAQKKAASQKKPKESGSSLQKRREVVYSYAYRKRLLRKLLAMEEEENNHGQTPVASLFKLAQSIFAGNIFGLPVLTMEMIVDILDWCGWYYCISSDAAWRPDRLATPADACALQPINIGATYRFCNEVYARESSSPEVPRRGSGSTLASTLRLTTLRSGVTAQSAGHFQIPVQRWRTNFISNHARYRVTKQQSMADFFHKFSLRSREGPLLAYLFGLLCRRGGVVSLAFLSERSSLPPLDFTDPWIN